MLDRLSTEQIEALECFTTALLTQQRIRTRRDV
jgi:hypothetical protein